MCSSVPHREPPRLIRLGLREGSPNQHPGQGTANRRFFFANSIPSACVKSPDSPWPRRRPFGPLRLGSSSQAVFFPRATERNLSSKSNSIAHAGNSRRISGRTFP